MFPLRVLSKTFVLLALFSGSRGRAGENRWTHFGLRPLGMGNAWVAVADDYNALFYNPAGLARLKSWDGEFLNPALDVNQKTLNIFQELRGAGNSLFKETGKALRFLQDHAGEIHHAGLYLTPHLIMPGFGLGLGLATDFSLVSHNTVNIDVKAGVQAIAPFTYAKSFLEEKLSIGVTLKLLMKVGLDHNFTMQDLTLLAKKEDGLKELLVSGSGIGVDAGFLLTPISPMEPTLGVSVTDIGGSRFNTLDTVGTEASTPTVRMPSVNMGISLKPIQYGSMYLLAAVDAHMLNQAVHFSHKLNLGLEFGNDILKLQLGLKEGHNTAGLQLDMGLLSLKVVTYAVDHAPLAGSHNNLVERRFAFQLKLLI